MENLHEYTTSSNNLTNNIYLLALNAANSGIIITDNLQNDNPIIYCNNAFEKLTGYSQEEIIGHNCRFLQSQDRDQKEIQILKNSVKNGKECKVELKNYKKNGTIFWNELFISPVKDHNNKITHFIGVQNDISERKKSENALRNEKIFVEKKIQERTKELYENEAFLSSIIQTVRESLLVLNSEYKVLVANNYFLKSFMVTKEDTVGEILFELGNHQWDIEALKTLLTKILPTNNPVIDFEVEHDFPNIGKKTMLLNAYRTEFEGQYKDRILIAIEDITDKKEMDRRKDDFLSVASHELKTPLTTIKGLIQLLQKMKPDNADLKFSSTLDKSEIYVNRLNNLISELLDTSKIQSGKLEIHKEPFDMDKLIYETIENLSFSNPSYNIIVNTETKAMILGDELQISQIIYNLVSNAIKYSPASKNIEINCERENNFIKLSVKDFGIGISHQDQSKIFDRFYRSSDIQKKIPGMGIGLYISNEIVVSHFGKLWVESEIGKGSKFNFTLPIMKS